jgi:hypothetical protein
MNLAQASPARQRVAEVNACPRARRSGCVASTPAPSRDAVHSLRVEQVRLDDVAERLEVAEQVRVRTVQPGQAP